MTIRKHLSLLLVILLIITMTGQAASAYILSCQGTVSCCCISPASDMDMSDTMPGGMDQNCCTTTPSDPCDIETTPHAAAEPFLSGFANGSVEGDMTAGLTGFIIDPGDDALHMARQAENFVDRSGPPIYLQIQSFLC